MEPTMAATGPAEHQRGRASRRRCGVAVGLVGTVEVHDAFRGATGVADDFRNELCVRGSEQCPTPFLNAAGAVGARREKASSRTGCPLIRALTKSRCAVTNELEGTDDGEPVAHDVR